MNGMDCLDGKEYIALILRLTSSIAKSGKAPYKKPLHHRVASYACMPALLPCCIYSMSCRALWFPYNVLALGPPYACKDHGCHDRSDACVADYMQRTWERERLPDLTREMLAALDVNELLAALSVVESHLVLGRCGLATEGDNVNAKAELAELVVVPLTHVLTGSHALMRDPLQTLVKLQKHLGPCEISR